MRQRWFLLFAGIAFLTPCASLSAADWARFRGPNGTGSADDKNLPVEWKADNILWKAPLAGTGNSSPIISKGKIFLQSSSGDAGRRFLICIDAKTGKTLWNKDVPGGQVKIHAKNSAASSTPAADGERIYTVFWDGKEVQLSAWNYEGQSLWNKPLGEFKSQHGPGLSPIVVGDRVIVNLDQDGAAEVQAYNVKDGTLIWKKTRGAHRASYGTPFTYQNAAGSVDVIVASTDGIAAYDPKDGKELWNWNWKFTAKMPLRVVGSPLAHQGMIFACSGDGAGDRHMVAVKIDGSGERLVWEKKKGTPYVPTLLAKGDYVFWVTDKENAAVCALAKTGEIVWSERLGGGAGVSASPVLVNDKIYSVDEKGAVYVFAAANKFELLAKNDLKEQVFASPAVADGKLYVRGQNHLFCIGAK